MSISVFSPAKLNLFLAVTGRRADGFHDLVSVVAPLNFGDTLEVDASAPAGEFSLTCDAPGLEVDETNLVLRAARAFAEASSWKGGARFALTKRIPMGAGLGGGSSNAVAALRGLNKLAGAAALPEERLAEVAARLGSDCALFLHARPIVMRGRGEKVDALPAGAAARLTGRRVLVFKPAFSISTVWAYRRMAEKASTFYLPGAEAEAKLDAWLAAPEGAPGAAAEKLLFNNMEGPAFEKFIALPVLLDVLRAEFGLATRMSGSGSACFALVPEGEKCVSQIKRRIREHWGEEAFVAEARIAG